MTISTIDNSQRTAAKVAGIALVFSMVIVVFANFALLNPLLVRGNAVETARNILAHETQYRVAVILFLTYSLNVVILLAALYVVLRPINHGLALAGALFRLVFAILWLLSTLNLLGALRLLGSAPYLQAFEPERLQVLARTYIAMTFDDYYVGLPFFGLAATVCAWLWLKSGYIPRWLALFGVISSAWCVVCAFLFLIFPTFNKTINDWLFDSPMALFELVLGFWLLLKGLRPPGIAEPGSIKNLSKSGAAT